MKVEEEKVSLRTNPAIPIYRELRKRRIETKLTRIEANRYTNTRMNSSIIREIPVSKREGTY